MSLIFTIFLPLSAVRIRILVSFSVDFQLHGNVSVVFTDVLFSIEFGVGVTNLLRTFLSFIV